MPEPSSSRALAPLVAGLLCLWAGDLSAARHGHELASPEPTSQTAWTTFKGDNARSGRALSRLTLPIKLKWRVHLRSSLYSSPAVVDGRVYLGSSSKRLYCLDLGDGKTLWEAPLPDRVWGSSPTVADGKVYVGAVDGCVYALDALTGQPLGSYCAQRVGSYLLGQKPDVLSSPLVEGSRLVFGSDNYDIYGWDVNVSATASWRFTTGDILHDNSAACLSATAYMSSRDGHAYALDLASGALRWTSAQIATPYNTVPSLDGERAYFSGGDGILHALSLADGKEQWSFKTGHILMSSPALDGQGTLVFGSGDHWVYALNAADGKQLWKFQTDDGILGSPLITGRTVWIGSFDQHLYALDLATGNEIWNADLGGGVFITPACVGDLVLAGGRDGDFACFQASYDRDSGAPLR
jgi:outer membrane protein assembly factor BamB